MSSHPQPDPTDDAELESAVDQAIAACGGDLRATVRALIVANNYLETEVAELMKANLLPNPDAVTVNGKSIGDNCKGAENLDEKVIRPVSAPLKEHAGFINLKGNLFDYHVDWNDCYASDVHLFSEHSCVWGADDFERLVKLPSGTDPGGKFIIVQSHARIPLERVRDYCLSFAG